MDTPRFRQHQSGALLFKELWKYDRFLLLFYLIRILVNVVQSTISVWFVGEMISALEKGHIDLAIQRMLILSGALLLLQILSTLLHYQIKIRLDAFQTHLHSRIAHSIFREDYELFESSAFRETFRFAQICVERGSIGSILNAVSSCISGLLAILALTTMLSFLTWWLWVIMLISVAVSTWGELYRANLNFEGTRSQESVEYKMLYSRDWLPAKRFAKEVRLFDMFQYVTSQAETYIDALAELQNERAHRSLKIYLLSYLFNGLHMIAVYGYIAYQCFQGDISIAEFSFFTLSVLSIGQQAIDLGRHIVAIIESKRYVGSFIDLLDAKDLPNAPRTSQALTDPIQEITFEDVSFTYDGREAPAIDHLTLKLTGNKTYGIVGKNGSGKSTFVNLLMGMYRPSKGTIKMNGVDIRSVDREAYHGLFATVFQDFALYAYRVEENITMGTPADKEEIMNYLEDLDLDDDLASRGTSLLDTHVGTEYSDQGHDFSGGEGQKLAIARALYRDAPVFILDEPSSALSPKSEAKLYQMVDQKLQNKTVFFISHRLASCVLCDDLLVFDEGRLVESGDHHTLMKKGGLYSQMFTTQKELYTEGSS